MFSHVTRRKVAMVRAKPIKPKRVLTNEIGESSEVLEMVTPMVAGMREGCKVCLSEKRVSWGHAMELKQMREHCYVRLLG